MTMTIVFGMLHYGMFSNIPHAVASGMNYMVFIGIPYGHMTMSYEILVCLCDYLDSLFRTQKKQIKQMFGINTQQGSC